MSKPVYLIGGLLIVILAAVGFFLPEETKSDVEKEALGIFAPLWQLVGQFKESRETVEEGFKTLHELQVEAEALRAVNAQLKTENAVFKDLEKENQRLREMLEFKNDSAFRLLPAKVISRSPSDWMNSVYINRGWRDDENLQPDQPVVTPRGVIGKTGIVDERITKVILLVDENCKISAVTENSRAHGIIVGATSTSSGTPVCRMTFVNRDSPFTTGERVLTTGLGKTFPANLVLGTIVDAPPLSEAENFGLYREGVIEPLVNLNDLHEVFILVGVK